MVVLPTQNRKQIGAAHYCYSMINNALGLSIYYKVHTFVPQSTYHDFTLSEVSGIQLCYSWLEVLQKSVEYH